jgi:hypothetical protein
LFRFIFLMEGRRAHPEEKQGPASGIEKLPRSQRHPACYRARSRQGQAAFGGGCAILAKSEGRQLQALVDEALADLLEKRRLGRPRAHVMAAYQASHEK